MSVIIIESDQEVLHAYPLTSKSACDLIEIFKNRLLSSNVSFSSSFVLQEKRTKPLRFYKLQFNIDSFKTSSSVKEAEICSSLEKLAEKVTCLLYSHLQLVNMLQLISGFSWFYNLTSQYFF